MTQLLESFPPALADSGARLSAAGSDSATDHRSEQVPPTVPAPPQTPAPPLFVEMSPRERRLRERIDKLTDERDWYRARVPKARHGHPTHCVFCGAKTKSYRYPAACRAHSDLPALDPLYAEELAA